MERTEQNLVRSLVRSLVEFWNFVIEASCVRRNNVSEERDIYTSPCLGAKTHVHRAATLKFWCFSNFDIWIFSTCFSCTQRPTYSSFLVESDFVAHNEPKPEILALILLSKHALQQNRKHVQNMTSPRYYLIAQLPRAPLLEIGSQRKTCSRETCSFQVSFFGRHETFLWILRFWRRRTWGSVNWFWESRRVAHYCYRK